MQDRFHVIYYMYLLGYISSTVDQHMMHKRTEVQRRFAPPWRSAIVRDIRFFVMISIVGLYQISNRNKVHAVTQQPNHLGLLVKVSTADEEMIINDNDFLSSVYSNSMYSVNKQLRACSSNRSPRLMPYRSNVTSVSEVMQVQLPNESATYNRTSIVLAAMDGVKTQLGLDETSRLGDLVDFVVFCVPTRLSGPTFLASGAYDSFWAVAKPSACANPRILLHEFGHMLGLKHARQDEDEYGDETSVMGRTSNAQNRCYNGYNLWKLGWFNNDFAREIVTTSDTPLPIKVSLATFLDVSKLQSEQPHLWTVVLKIDEYYLVYNRRKGYNNETGELPDMVTVVRALDTDESNLIVGLNETEGSNVYQFFNNQSQLVTIQTCRRHHGNATTADHFVVAIGADDFPCKSASNENETLEVTTNAPSRMPIIRRDGNSLAPTLRPRSVPPNLPVVIRPPTLAPSKYSVSRTQSPSNSIVDADASVDLSTDAPIRRNPTVAPLSRSAAPTVVGNATTVPVPTVRPSNTHLVDHGTPSPSFIIPNDSQTRTIDNGATDDQFVRSHVVIITTATIIGLVWLAVVIRLGACRRSHVAGRLPPFKP